MSWEPDLLRQAGRQKSTCLSYAFSNRLFLCIFTPALILQNSVRLRVENILFENNNYVAIFVDKDISKLITTTSGKTCIREGRNSRPMTPEELQEAIKSLQFYDWSSELGQKLYRIFFLKNFSESLEFPSVLNSMAIIKKSY